MAACKTAGVDQHGLFGYETGISFRSSDICRLAYNREDMAFSKRSYPFSCSNTDISLIILTMSHNPLPSDRPFDS